MSERSDLNSSDRPQPDVIQRLAGLEPQKLKVDRDELFFQAGYAAGKSRGIKPKLWPAAAAALLLISVGLASALTYQTMALHSTQYALKWSEKSQTMIAENAAKPQAAVQSVDNQSSFQADRISLDERSLRWQRLASPAPLPPGRLTAMGWEPRRPEMGSGQTERPAESDESPEPSKPHRPSTYLDLLRLQQEG